MAKLKEILEGIEGLDETVKNKILEADETKYKPLDEFNRVYNALEGERKEHKAKKEILDAFDNITPEQAKEYKKKAEEKLDLKITDDPASLNKLISEKLKPYQEELETKKAELKQMQDKIDEGNLERHLREISAGKIDPKAVTDLIFRAKATLKKSEKDGKFYTSDGTVSNEWFEKTLPETNWAIKGAGIGATGSERKSDTKYTVEEMKAKLKEYNSKENPTGKEKLEAMELAKQIKQAEIKEGE